MYQNTVITQIALYSSVYTEYIYNVYHKCIKIQSLPIALYTLNTRIRVS